MDILANLSEDGRRTFTKLNEKALQLKRKVENEEQLFENSPSYELKRAMNSLPYHEREVQEMEEALELKIKKLKERLEAAKQRLEACKQKIEAEKSHKPKSLLRAEMELRDHLTKMKNTLPLPPEYFGKFSLPPTPSREIPVVQQPPPPVPEVVPEPPKKQVSFEEWSEGCDRFFGVDEELKKAREQAREIPRQEKPSYYTPPPPQEDDRPRIIQTTKKPIKKVAPR